MTKHHFREKEKGWKAGAWINGVGAVLSFIVLIIVASMKFAEGAWVIMILVPVMVVGLVRLNKAYEAEISRAEGGRAGARAGADDAHAFGRGAGRRPRCRLRGALQYARTLTAQDLRAVHLDLDAWKTSLLVESWRELGLSSFPLDIVECPDRRVPRAVLELATEITADNDTQLTVLVPRREYTKFWHRLLHDHSSSAIASTLEHVPHCNVMFVPYELGSRQSSERNAAAVVEPLSPRPMFGEAKTGPAAPNVSPATLPTDRTRIADLVPRQRSTVAGRVRSIRVQPWGGNPALECSVADETGTITIVFFGRREVMGIRLGTILSVTGIAGDHHGMRAFLNPEYTLISTPPAPSSPQHH